MRETLRSSRLWLEPVEPRDATALHSHWTEPEVREFLWDGIVIHRQQVDEIIAKSDRLFDDPGAGLWAMRTPDGAFLGCAGFWFFHEPPELELVISLSPSEWGTGTASEACRTLVDYALDELGWPFIQASADSPNERSLRLIRSLGYERTGERPGEVGTIQVFRLER